MMRPRSIAVFERIILISMALGMFNVFLSWDRTVSNLRPTTPHGFVVGLTAFVFLIYLILLWFISRRGSTIAMWIYVVLTVVGLPGTIANLSRISSYGLLPAAITVAQLVLTAASLWLLFRPEARAWFRKERPAVDPEIFR